MLTIVVFISLKENMIVAIQQVQVYDIDLNDVKYHYLFMVNNYQQIGGKRHDLKPIRLLLRSCKKAAVNLIQPNNIKILTVFAICLWKRLEINFL